MDSAFEAEVFSTCIERFFRHQSCDIVFFGKFFAPLLISPSVISPITDLFFVIIPSPKFFY